MLVLVIDKVAVLYSPAITPAKHSPAKHSPKKSNLNSKLKNDTHFIKAFHFRF